MNAVVIDTNVLVVANGRSAAPQSSQECVVLCQKRLSEILGCSHKIILDDKKRIIQEYKNNLNQKGRGFGDRFWQELVRRIWNPKDYPEKVVRVSITSLEGNGTEFEEFPNDDASLKDFHKKDKKFVAVSLAYQSESGEEAPILKADDKGWENFKSALAAHGVEIISICEENTS